MKSFNVLVLTLALSILLAAIIGACKDGVSRKRIIIRTRRRCKTSGQSSAKRLKNDAKTVKVLGKKLKNALKTLITDFKSNAQTKTTGQD
jgi:hypothetical protein